MPEPKEFNPLTKCLHCAIAQMIYHRHAHGVEDDIYEILARLIESIAEVCSAKDTQDERRQLLGFCAELMSSTFTDVANMRWKHENAGPSATEH